MKVEIQYFGQLRYLAKIESEYCESPDSTELGIVLSNRSEIHGDSFHKLIFDENKNIRPTILIQVNDTTIDNTKPPDLRDGDEIMILTPIAGG